MKKQNIKLLVFMAILLIGVGYAAISTTLTITGSASIQGDPTNFSSKIAFASASLVDVDGAAGTASYDGRNLTFTTKTFTNLTQEATLTYTIKNESNYNVTIAAPTCSVTDSNLAQYITITAPTSEVALNKNSTTDTQTIKVKMAKTYAEETLQEVTINCTFNASASDAQ